MTYVRLEIDLIVAVFTLGDDLNMSLTHQSYYETRLSPELLWKVLD